MSLEKIQQALITQLKAGLPAWVATQMAWENVPFNPPEAKPWLYFVFMPVEESIATLGPSGYDLANGLAHIDINYPKGGGERDLRATVDALRTAFKPGTLTYSGQGVTILGRNRSAGFVSENFYRVPFTVRWRAFLTR